MRVPAAGLFVAFVLALAVGADAHEFTREGVTVLHPWARATPGGAKVGGAFLEIKTVAGKGDRLIAAHSPIAGTAEVHVHIMQDGIARMRRVEVIAIAGGKSIVFEPSGYHVMLMDLKQPLKEGDLIKLTLVFEKAGEIEVNATVEPIGAMGPHGFDHQPGAKKSPHSGGHKH